MGFGNNNGGGNPNHDEQGKFTTANGGNHSGNSISAEEKIRSMGFDAQNSYASKLRGLGSGTKADIVRNGEDINDYEEEYSEMDGNAVYNIKGEAKARNELASQIVEMANISANDDSMIKEYKVNSALEKYRAMNGANSISPEVEQYIKSKLFGR